MTIFPLLNLYVDTPHEFTQDILRMICTVVGSVSYINKYVVFINSVLKMQCRVLGILGTHTHVTHTDVVLVKQWKAVTASTGLQRERCTVYSGSAGSESPNQGHRVTHTQDKRGAGQDKMIG